MIDKVNKYAGKLALNIDLKDSLLIQKDEKLDD